jgi:hypothetical protein
LQQLNTKTKFSAPQMKKKTIVLVQVARESTDEKVHTKKLLSSFYKKIQVLSSMKGLSL